MRSPEDVGKDARRAQMLLQRREGLTAVGYPGEPARTQSRHRTSRPVGRHSQGIDLAPPERCRSGARTFHAGRRRPRLSGAPRIAAHHQPDLRLRACRRYELPIVDTALVREVVTDRRNQRLNLASTSASMGARCGSDRTRGHRQVASRLDCSRNDVARHVRPRPGYGSQPSIRRQPDGSTMSSP